MILMVRKLLLFTFTCKEFIFFLDRLCFNLVITYLLTYKISYFTFICSVYCLISSRYCQGVLEELTEDKYIKSGRSFFQDKTKLMSIIAKQVPSHAGYMRSIGSLCHFQILLSSCIH